MKKLEQHVDDHDQYKQAHSQCSHWLAANKQRLLLAADTVGDKDTILAQIDALHVSPGFLRS